ncbi:NGG1p interacting factor NIF3 [Thiomicrospira microaerophila]|uniref:NGG1p interacting factor NIF3 n=1 Tax=Thiomicrospira microaerophila TaxID=406020 RepID=UPI00200E07DD|nr:NGG1p interacting factor NIF3 [Thiomicrospira microaerophila]UQB42622.1 NGG1p interacting factor NIF3 [Thiomicrospira microaerophila]
MFKLIYFVPVEALDSTKQAVFSAGAGRLGNYEQCAWQTLGLGQFKPCEGASPYLGQAGLLEVVEEYRVETLVNETLIDAVIRALKLAHPYEEPAYEVVRLEVF